MKKVFQILFLSMIIVFSAYSSVRQRTFAELGAASDWIRDNRLELIITSEEKEFLPGSEVLNHSVENKDEIRESFNRFIKSEELRGAYIQANIQKIFKILNIHNKSLVPDISENALVNSINEPLSKNFDSLVIKIMGIKWQPETIELTVTIEGKNLVYPLVLNVNGLEQDTLEPVSYLNDVLDDMNTISAGKTNVKLIYNLENGYWVLDDQNFLKFLNAMVLIKYYNRNIEESL